MYQFVGGIEMAVSYKKLFHLLIEKDITNNQLMQRANFSGNIITRLKRNQYISLESLENICRVCRARKLTKIILPSCNCFYNWRKRR